MSGMVMMGLDEATAKMYALYGENRKITDGNYDRSLGVKCINGTFVGKKTGNIIAYKGIPFVGKQPVGNLRWKARAVPVRWAASTPRVRTACI